MAAVARRRREALIRIEDLAEGLADLFKAVPELQQGL